MCTCVSLFTSAELCEREKAKTVHTASLENELEVPKCLLLILAGLVAFRLGLSHLLNCDRWTGSVQSGIRP